MSKFERVDEKLNSLLANSTCVLIRYYKIYRRPVQQIDNSL